MPATTRSTNRNSWSVFCGERSSVVDGFAAKGYIAVAPAVFVPAERNVELGYDDGGMQRGIALRAARVRDYFFTGFSFPLQLLTWTPRLMKQADLSMVTRNPKLPGIVRGVLSKARRAVKSKSGKALLRKRGEHLERSFCHVLDHGSLRRATLRGRENLTKRQLGGALAYNLSLLMRHLLGQGTPKQWLAAACAVVTCAMRVLLAWIGPKSITTRHGGGLSAHRASTVGRPPLILRLSQMAGFSTGC